MNMSLFEYKMTELDRQVLVTSVANKNLVPRRLRRLAPAIEPRPAPRRPFLDRDKLPYVPN